MIALLHGTAIAANYQFHRRSFFAVVLEVLFFTLCTRELSFYCAMLYSTLRACTDAGVNDQCPHLFNTTTCETTHLLLHVLINQSRFFL